MMRQDGRYEFFLIQHKNPQGGWRQSALDHFLFHKMSFEDKSGDLGDHYRALTQPERDCWQRIGVEAFLALEDAQNVLPALQETHPDTQFRIIKRYILQRSEVVGEEAAWQRLSREHDARVGATGGKVTPWTDQRS